MVFVCQVANKTPGYQNNDQPHACLNNFVGTNDFYQRTTNGYTYIFATSDNAMGGLNIAIANGPGNTITQTQNVVINDVTAPVADVATLADVTAECEVTDNSTYCNG